MLFVPEIKIKKNVFYEIKQKSFVYICMFFFYYFASFFKIFHNS